MFSKKIIYMLLIFFIIAPVNANSNNWILSQDTQNSDTSNFVYYAQTDDLCIEMDKMESSQEFQNYLQKNGINTDDHELKLVSSSSNVPLKVIVHTPNQEWHYAITNIATYSFIKANNLLLKFPTTWNQFRVANKCGSTLGAVRTSYFAFIHISGVNTPIVVKERRSVRYNLANDGVLNYDPSSDQTHCTISVFKKSSDIIPCTFVLMVDLGKWHTAYVKKDSNYYIKLV